jgi:thiol:disulfide interchange protein
MQAFIRQLLLFSLALGIFTGAKAQIQTAKAKWTYTFSKSEVKTGEEVELILKAVIEKDWYMYSNDMDPNLGPVVASFTFTPHPSYKTIGAVKAINAKHKFDDVWNGEVAIFKDKAEFRQKVKILAANPVIKGSSEYQTCTEVSGICLPGEEEFEFKGLSVIGGNEKNSVVTTNESLTHTNQSDDTINHEESLEPNPSPKQTETKKEICEKTNMSVPNDSYIKDDLTGNSDGSSEESLLGFMIYAFLFGLGAIFTPCVFPMIPMTVTFFTKKQENGRFKAFMYGFFIIAIYTIIGTLVAIFMGPDFANWLSTHWLPNLLFFFIFLIFGASFLGLFEITLPHSFVNRIDRKSAIGGMGGIFFMAFTMVLISFSCTGPLVGSVLIQAFGGNYLRPVAGMFAFSLAFAIPFTLFAIFPQWLTNLPKSGGWLNSVKVVFGFIELALALKFLSVADTVYHWGLLDRDVYLALWIAIFTLMGSYLLGKLKLSHDSDLPYVSVPRLMLALLAFAFSLYLIPGMIGAPLKALSGYMPPQHTLSIDLYTSNDKSQSIDEEVKHENFLHLPHNLKGFYDYCQALKYSKKIGKPVFIDFTGHGCVNCREMEASVWSHPEVLKRLKENYVVVALYADEYKHTLPESEWYTSPYDNKEKKNIGKQTLDLQIRKFNANAQPLYVLIDGDENLLAKPRSYDKDVDAFIKFLDKGSETFKKIQSLKDKE